MGEASLLFPYMQSHDVTLIVSIQLHKETIIRMCMVYSRSYEHAHKRHKFTYHLLLTPSLQRSYYWLSQIHLHPCGLVFVLHACQQECQLLTLNVPYVYYHLQGYCKTVLLIVLHLHWCNHQWKMDEWWGIILQSVVGEVVAVSLEELEKVWRLHECM